MRDNLIKKLQEKFKTNGERLNYIQDLVDEVKDIDKTGVERFFIKLNLDYEKTIYEDGSLINGRYFDWKEYENKEVLDAILDLVDEKLNSEAKELVYNKILN